jgi:hypothetical protein
MKLKEKLMKKKLRLDMLSRQWRKNGRTGNIVIK